MTHIRFAVVLNYLITVSVVFMGCSTVFPFYTSNTQEVRTRERSGFVIVSRVIPPNAIILYSFISFLILPYSFISYPILSENILSNPILLYFLTIPILSYPVLSYPGLRNDSMLPSTSPFPYSLSICCPALLWGFLHENLYIIFKPALDI